MSVRPATARLDYLIEHAHFVTFEAPEGAVMQYSRNEFRDLIAMYVREAVIPPDAVVVTEESLAEGLKVVTRGTWSTPTRRHPDAQAAQDERWLRDTAAAIFAALRAHP